MHKVVTGISLSIIALSAFALIAEDKKEVNKEATKEVVKEIPKIPSEHLVDFFKIDGLLSKLQSNMKDLNASIKKGQDDLKIVIEVMQKDCGNDYVPFQNPQDGQITCSVKPPESSGKIEEIKK